MTEKAPLWDQAAERSVIGGLLFDDRCMADVAAVVQPGDFRHQAHGEIFAAAQRLHAEGHPVDVVTLGDAVRAKGHTVLVGAIAAEVPSAANVVSYAEIVADYSRRRAIVNACQHAIHAARRDRASDVAAELSARLESANEQAIGESINFGTALQRMLDDIERATKAGDEGILGVRTHLPMIDQSIGGLCEGRLVVVAARPSIGKTALCNQFAVTAARDGVPVGVASLEMSESDLAGRAMALHSKSNFTRLMRGHDEELSNVVRSMGHQNPKSWPIHIDTDSYDLAAIEARITSWKRNHGIRLAVVDHIGLIDAPGYRTPNERLSAITKQLKRLAKRLGIAIIAVSQLNRNGEREGRRPTLADLRDSGSIEQDADIVIALHVDADDLETQPTPVNVGLLKNRSGRRGWLPETLLFNGRTQTFTEQAHHHEENIR